MLKREDILKIMEDFPCSKENYVLGFKGALVLHGVYEETHDLDIFVRDEAGNNLIEKGYTYDQAPMGGSKIIFSNNVDCFPGELPKDTMEIDGVRVCSLCEIIKWYKWRGREKDFKTIERIYGFLKKEA